MTFEQLLATQAGRFTRGQALRGGFSSYRISHRIESGEWRVVRGRVLALVAVPDSLETREWVALLSAGAGLTGAVYCSVRSVGRGSLCGHAVVSV